MTTETAQVEALVLHGAKDLRTVRGPAAAGMIHASLRSCQESRSLPAPAADEVQIAVHSTGLCGSDLHYYHHNRNGDIIVREPLTLGHESSGTVTAVGSSVSSLKAGDRVALEVGIPCEKCNRCEEGRYNICKEMRFRSSAKSFPHFQGTLQERINHPARWCHKLPEGVSMELGALLEPLGVAIHGYRRSLMKPGATVLVFGAGAVGLLCAAVAKVKGAKTVVIADIDAGRVGFATENGFAHQSFTVPMKRGKDTEENLAIAKENAEALAKVTDKEGKEVGEFDVVFECTGVPACVQAGIYVSTRLAVQTKWDKADGREGYETRWPRDADRHGRAYSDTRNVGCCAP